MCSAWPATPWIGAGDGSSGSSTATEAARTTPSTRARQTLHTGADLPTHKQKDRLLALFAADEHVKVEATWTIYQQMIAAYREPDRTRGRALMVKLIESLSHGVPAALS
jgi:transposase